MIVDLSGLGGVAAKQNGVLPCMQMYLDEYKRLRKP